MSTSEFIARLAGLEIVVVREGDRLKINAPRGTLTPELREELTLRKPELLAYLGHRDEAGAAGEASEPLSFAQQRLWFVDRLSPGGFAYNLTGGLRLEGPLDVAAFEWSLGEVIRRHEPLRTVFQEEDGRPIAVVQPFEGFHLPVERVTPEPAEDAETALRRLLVEEGRKPFDLSDGPVIRTRLYRLGPDDHAVQITMHHIVADSWSLGVFARELTSLYAMRVAGGSAELPPLAARYGEIAARQRARLVGPAGVKDAAYWRERMTPLPPLVELPTDRPRPALQGYDGAVEERLLPAPMMAALRRTDARNGSTPFMTLLAAFNVLLHRYTGLTDIAVGSPIANRTDLEAEAVIGLLANTLVLRTDLSGDPTFTQVVARVRDIALGAYAHQDLPFERLVEIVRPARATSHSALFQVMFSLQNAPVRALELAGLAIQHIAIDIGCAKTDLTLHAADTPDGLRLQLEYNTDLFEASTIRRMADHFERLLTAALEQPDTPISQLPLLTEPELRLSTQEWNATDTPLADETVTQRFERQAARSPHAVAARFDDVSRTYGELNADANRLAHLLRRHGVGAGVPVGLCISRSIDMLTAVLAVLKAGGAYVPLDPWFPVDRLAFMAQDSAIPVLLTEDSLQGRFDLPAGVRTICIDGDAAAIAAEPANDVAASGAASPDDPAYIIYTSGSTGRPKGVIIGHRSLMNLLESFRAEPGIDANDVLVAVTTLSFDIAGLELLLPLIAGAQVVIASREAASDPASLAALLRNAGATVLQATPATWRLLVDSGWNDGNGLRILCGGEALHPDLARRLVETGAAVWNVYGPTETTIWSTCHRVTGGDAGTVPIGRPIANTRLYVLDPMGQPVPVGVPGELYIGGEGVAIGYLNRPELTAERFVTDPFAGRSAARMYRTGDVVRQRADGVVEYIGRADHQVKVRGFRIELGEIENVLGAHPAVAQAVVVVRENQPGDAYLAAYVRLSNGRMPDASEYRAFLKERLPDYMLPAAFTPVDAFPMTPNGKIDRQHLPEPDNGRPVSRAPFAAPRNRLERAIADVWCDVLRLQSVGPDDNFFDLGGHSLLLVQAQTRIRNATGHEVKVVDMFRYPTIRTFAAHLARNDAVSA